MPARQTRRDKGAGSVVKTDTGKYRAFVQTSPDPATGERRRVSATGRTRTEALEKAREKLRLMEGDPHAWDRIPTVAEWCEKWLDEIIEPKRTPNTTKTYRNAVKLRIIPIMGALPLDEVRPHHIRMLEQMILEGNPRLGVKARSPATTLNTWRALNSALDAAVNEGIIDRNPMKGCEPPMMNDNEIRILTPLQAGRLIRMEPDPQYRLIWRILYTTGMRLGETLGLTAGEIMEKDGVPFITIQWQLQRFDGVEDESRFPKWYAARHVGGRLWLVRPKTRSSRRSIPITMDLADEIRRHMEDTGRKRSDDLIFLTRRGNPFGRSTIHPAWDNALERAGLPHVRIHSARHTLATMLATLGVSDVYREAIIGHADISTTNRVYTHTDIGHLGRVIDAVGTLLETPEPMRENALTCADKVG
ncbi:site-specific integrase [Bifidobacterium sp. SO1]|uniref:site-specific integrase n=1 Tax=Bifidobacterium sp. SO1 TaxID=2809029 RepID=UPI001BDBE22D|nr:site-specific integrase [Bifidobacterium sp. SO1]MBT1161675.1 site-specific integrase [Bifidobacterium sp. SO1]